MWGKRREVEPRSEVSEAAAEPVLASGVPEVSADGSTADAAKPAATPASTQPTLETEGSVSETAQQSPHEAEDTKAQLFWRTKLKAANFGNMVVLLANSPLHKHFSLADLEWLLIPPILHNQFVLVEGRMQTGQPVPVALVLWARVSQEVDARLTEKARYPIRLHLTEWKSGDHFWIIDAVGEKTVVNQVIAKLAKTAFAGKSFKTLRTCTSTARSEPTATTPAVDIRVDSAELPTTDAVD